jgi:hypothetical protein
LHGWNSNALTRASGDALSGIRRIAAELPTLPGMPDTMSFPTTPEFLMSLSMHSASVPVFHQILAALGEILTKAETHATERKIEPAALLQSRLFPDMFNLARQVQIACDFAASVSARLAGAEVPAYEGGDQGFTDLQQRIAATLSFIAGLDAARFEGSEQREIVLRPGTPKERRIGGQAYLLSYGLPQFFFHVTTAYALLRHNGVEIGKKDYMGS